MRQRRRKHCVPELTDEEKDKLQEARAAHEEAHGLLAESRARGAEIEAVTAWLRRARARNNFSERVALMLQQGRDQSS